jgi:hypothetical protein
LLIYAPALQAKSQCNASSIVATFPMPLLAANYLAFIQLASTMTPDLR